MKALRPKDYEYLWSNQDYDFFFVSYWLNKEWRKRDVLVMCNHKNQEAKYFLSKQSKQSLSRLGIVFYDTTFPIWKQKVHAIIKNTEKAIRDIYARDLSLLSNNDLKRDFLAAVKIYQSFGELYFFTEFFMEDGVAEKIRKEPRTHNGMYARTLEMQTIKLRMRKVINHFWFKEGIFQEYLDEVKGRTKRKDLRWLGFKEIARILEGYKVPVSQRGVRDWMVTKHNNWQPIVGSKATATLKSFDDAFFKEAISEIKGHVATPGMYTGKVRIIRTIFGKEVKKDLLKMIPGEVLVTASTGPELITACKKAGAIVTDVGGICSHAAIISRELHKPCVIGTRIGTIVLQDGDIVEVDAHKGIVKIIQKA